MNVMNPKREIMSLNIVEVSTDHDEELSCVIKRVGAEYGAVGEGFGPSDAEVDEMSAYCTKENRSHYLVALLDGKVVGGCGLAPFGNDTNTCELKKLFLLEESRGLGLGKQLAIACLEIGRASCRERV